MAIPKRNRILIVDDEVELMHALCDSLKDQQFQVQGVTSPAEAIDELQDGDYDVLLSDLMMPGMDGIQLLRKALEIDPNLVGIIMTGQGTISTAVEAMKIGAFDYILKPFKIQAILPVLSRAMEVRSLRLENVRLRQYVEDLTFSCPRYRLIGASLAMQKVLHMIEKVAPTDATVLVRGPSGTGKELVAQALHHNSLRKDRPMVTINCAALAGNAARIGTVRPRKRGLHGCGRHQTRPVRSGRGRDALYRRNRRDVARHAGQIAARSGGRPLSARRRHQGIPCRRARDRRDQQGVGRRAEGRPLPGGPVLPAQRHRSAIAAAQRSA